MRTRSSRSANTAPRPNRERSHPRSQTVSDDDAIDGHLAEVQKGIHELRKETESLRKKNRKLQEELDELHESEDARPSDALLQQRVQSLEEDVRNLEKARKRDRKEMCRLRAKEIEKEAAELVGDHQADDGQVRDVANDMRKLLSTFNDLMLNVVLDDPEDCTICMDTMVPRRCSSLQCEHIFCNSCLAQIAKFGASDETLNCPTCRQGTSRDEIQLVQYTAGEQWDKLLDVAKEWGALDMWGEERMSEGEEEEAFLDDNDGDSGTSEMSAMHHHEIGNSPEPEPPPRKGQSEGGFIPYSQSPTKVKRRRMEELVEGMERKRKR